MSESAVKLRKIDVDYPKDNSKTFLIHIYRHSSDEYKVLIGV